MLRLIRRTLPTEPQWFCNCVHQSEYRRAITLQCIQIQCWLLAPSGSREDWKFGPLY